MKPRNIIMLFFLFINYEILSGDNYKISGKVKDKNNGLPLVGANVFLDNTSIGTAANDQGFYEIKNIRKGNYFIKVAYIGYESFSDSLIIDGEEKNIELNIDLNYTTIEGNEVIVTAQAKGQMDAINRQLSSKSLVNIISSDRIQELPDANAAETVARVPGVSIRREGGEGNKVVIRGLSPKYNNITVNGVKLASTDNDNRSTDLSMISQYMLDGIEVTKAGTPDQDAGVLGGTVNFRLKKAKPGFHGSVIIQGMHNGLRNSYDDNKLVLDISQRFWENRIGILGQIDREYRNRSSNEISTSYIIMGASIDTTNLLELQSLDLNDWIRYNKRQNMLQVYDVNIPNGNISYSLLRSNIDKDISRYITSYALTTNSRNMNSVQTEGSINVLTESWKYEQTFWSNFHLDVYYSFSQSKNDEKSYNFDFQEPFAYDSSTYNQSIEIIQQIAKNDTSNTSFLEYDYNSTLSMEKESAKGFNFKYDFRLTNFISGNLKFGYKNRKKDRSFDRHFEFLMGFAAQGYGKEELISYLDIGHLVTDPNKIPLLGLIDSDYNNESFFDGRYSFGAVADLDIMMDVYRWYKRNWDKTAVQARYGNEAITADTEVVHHIHQANSQIYDYSGKEQYEGSYFMSDINFGSKVNMIAGARIEKNKTTYNSFNSLDHALPHWVFVGQPESHKRKNSHFLPALFLTYKPKSSMQVRYAHTHTITRPDYTSIIPLTRANGQGKTLDWRNKFLEPGLSKNTDLSFSINDNRLGLFTITYFNKNIKDLIYQSGSRIVFDEDTARFELSSNYEDYRIINYSQNNPNSAYLGGFEFDYQTRFWYLPGPFSGLVFNANYTKIESEVKYPLTFIEQEIIWNPFQVIKHNRDTTYTDQLLDQPNEIINLSLGYDYKGFSARLSMLYNDDVFMSTNFWSELRQTTAGYRRWDLSVKQNLSSIGIEIFLNANNITGTNDVNRYRGVTSSGDNLSSEQHYGRTVDLGFRYSF